jgi:hypothetical protein
MTPAAEITLTHTLAIVCSRCGSPMMGEVATRGGKRYLKVTCCVVCREADVEAFGVLAAAREQLTSFKETVHAN